MDPSYQNLVRAICSGQDDLKRFRQLLVQTVMATDIADAELRTARNQRWDKAFAKKDLMTDASVRNDEDKAELDADKNRKATIVLEHLLQASDIAHTMQHWEVFKKWVRLAGIAYREERAISVSVARQFYCSPILLPTKPCRMRSFSERCILPICMAVRTKTLVTFGTLGKLAFSSFTL
jgi:3'5'-cyclic nucleotide phosphodiesterase